MVKCQICLSECQMTEHVVVHDRGSCSAYYHEKCFANYYRIDDKKQCPVCKKIYEI